MVNDPVKFFAAGVHADWPCSAIRLYTAIVCAQGDTAIQGDILIGGIFLKRRRQK